MVGRVARKAPKMREVSHFMRSESTRKTLSTPANTAIANSVSQKPQPAAPPIASSQANPAPSQAKSGARP